METRLANARDYAIFGHCAIPATERPPMPISWNEIKNRALEFSKKWADETSESAESQSFWNDFFHIFGVNRRKVATFEHSVNKLGNKRGSIDLFWPGVLLVEQKSRGSDLDKAYDQAIGYLHGLDERDFPQYVLLSDFARFRITDLETRTTNEFALSELYQNIKRFGFIAGYQTQPLQEQDPVNIKAAELMGRLHDQLRDSGYTGHALEVYLVRLLFCLFAEDTSIFSRQQFQDYIEQRTREDGSDLGMHLSQIFQVLNTPRKQRQTNLDEQCAEFPYVNGQLFAEILPTAAFTSDMRITLLHCCALDWSRISPAIFGSLFQSIMDKKARRNLGAHYTSEGNILKLIKPLFLDDLWSEFHRSKHKPAALKNFQHKLRDLKFLDPACGCGNFLVIAYRELRLLELEVLRAFRKSTQIDLNVASLINVNVDQFYGIEIEEFPAQIAQVALWLVDHQMNMMVSEEFGFYFARIPLRTNSTIVHGNALQMNWEDVVSTDELDYIMGNPPFVGKKEQSKGQKNDFSLVMGQIKNFATLDFVSAWYVKAARMMQGTDIRCAFVSTNSITQGEQVGVLWGWMLAQGLKIFFAHRTFAWSSEARGKAAVHVAIIGFALHDITPKRIFDYEDIKGDPHELKANNINPYLIDAEDIIINRRSTPISNIPLISKGSEATDFGYLFLGPDEKNCLLKEYPISSKWIKKAYGGDELINNIQRYCLWLVDANPAELKTVPPVLDRIAKVREVRLTSNKKRTQEWANQPTLFSENRQPITPYLAIPKVSSERRSFLPIAYLDESNIATGSLLTIPNAATYHFGILTSTMHMAWMRVTSGRMKSDYQYSAKITYNNFPWPQVPSDAQKQTIESAAQDVLDARAQFPDASLADLYDPLTMPPVLLKAHQRLDRAVDAAYSQKKFNNEAERVAFLFALYQQCAARADGNEVPLLKDMPAAKPAPPPKPVRPQRDSGAQTSEFDPAQFFYLRNLMRRLKDVPRLKAMRELGRLLGIQRIGSRQKERLQRVLNAAAERHIVVLRGDRVLAGLSRIADYDDTWLAENLPELILRHETIDIDELSARVKTWLGFARISDVFKDKVQRAVDSAVQQDRLTQTSAGIRRY